MGQPVAPEEKFRKQEPTQTVNENCSNNYIIIKYLQIFFWCWELNFQAGIMASIAQWVPGWIAEQVVAHRCDSVSRAHPLRPFMETLWEKCQTRQHPGFMIKAIFHGGGAAALFSTYLSTGIRGLPTRTILTKKNLRFSNLGSATFSRSSSSAANASAWSGGVYIAVARCKAEHLDKQPEKQPGSCSCAWRVWRAHRAKQ